MATSECFALPSVHDHEVMDVHTDSAGTFFACFLDRTVAVYELTMPACVELDTVLVFGGRPSLPSLSSLALAKVIFII
jgi:hypothetical protein